MIIINGLPSTSDLIVFIQARYPQSEMIYNPFGEKWGRLLYKDSPALKLAAKRSANFRQVHFRFTLEVPLYPFQKALIFINL
ncbi:hypothetical protein VN97_g3813 [Penicillium thymicola]|uniref:Uncharacterized protein n=1 Tax=Penicillium thymicola TaxID=293382 RepID=A0AAI9X9V9_PENTH|nr:hypothetical protein VN97_g3813 [Penicillium thymicola]